MILRVVDEIAIVRAEPRSSGTPIGRLAPGTVVSAKPVRAPRGIRWYEVSLPDEQKGFLSAELRVESVPEVVLDERETALLDEPSPLANVLATLKRGARL